MGIFDFQRPQRIRMSAIYKKTGEEVEIVGWRCRETYIFGIHRGEAYQVELRSGEKLWVSEEALLEIKVEDYYKT